MFSFKTRLLFFIALTITVVIVVWLYAQKTYSEFDLDQPAGSENVVPQNPLPGTPSITQAPVTAQNSTPAPTNDNVVSADAGCTLPLVYWLQNQTKIPPQILVKSSALTQAEVCVNYAESEICTILGQESSDPGVFLRQQFLVAIMNYLSGADTGAIGDTINDAYVWLRSHLFNAPESEEELQEARLYAQSLLSFNQGDIGPGACELEGVAVAYNAATPFSATSASGTGDAAATLAPTLTSAPTSRPPVIIIIPTSTEPPDEEPEPTLPPLLPTDTQPVPTEPPPPQPTDTQIPPPPPTEPPTPTPVSENPTPTPVP